MLTRWRCFNCWKREHTRIHTQMLSHASVCPKEVRFLLRSASAIHSNRVHVGGGGNWGWPASGKVPLSTCTRSIWSMSTTVVQRSTSHRRDDTKNAVFQQSEGYRELVVPFWYAVLLLLQIEPRSWVPLVWHHIAFQSTSNMTNITRFPPIAKNRVGGCLWKI